MQTRRGDDETTESRRAVKAETGEGSASDEPERREERSDEGATKQGAVI
jgi:hypothetical protein